MLSALRQCRCLGVSLIMVCQLMTLSNSAFAWGDKGHQFINKAASEMMTSPLGEFLRTNQQRYTELSLVPDSQWKRTKNVGEEKPMHFFQWDFYGTSRIAGNIPMLMGQAIRSLNPDQVQKNGTAVWRAGSLYGKLVSAIKNSEWEQVVQLAGVLGHYVADMSMPMHASSDYDGQSINRRGIHGYYEIDLVNRMANGSFVGEVVKEGSAQLRNLTLRSDINDQKLAVIEMVAKEAEQSNNNLVHVLDDFGNQNASAQNDNALMEKVKIHMGIGSAALANVLDGASAEANVSNWPTYNNRPLKVKDPSWIPLNNKVD